MKAVFFRGILTKTFALLILNVVRPCIATHAQDAILSADDETADTEKKGDLGLPPSPPLVVTRTADTNDGVCNSDSSLREDVAAAPSATTRIFDVSGNPVLLASMTHSGGNVILFDSNAGCESTVRGGAIRNNGTLTLNSVHVTGSSVSGKITNGVRLGGGVSSSQRRTLTIIGSTFTANSVSGPGDSLGGGLYSAGTLRVYNSSISGNSVNTTIPDGFFNGSAIGGGIVREGGTAMISACTSNAVRIRSD